MDEMRQSEVHCCLGSCLPLPLIFLSEFLGLPEQRSLHNYWVFIT